MNFYKFNIVVIMRHHAFIVFTDIKGIRKQKELSLSFVLNCLMVKAVHLNSKDFNFKCL